MARLTYDLASGQFRERTVNLDKVHFGNRKEVKPTNDIEIPF